MRYEWDIETWIVHDDGEQEILDHNHRDRLAEFSTEAVILAINQDQPLDGEGDFTRLVLVRDTDGGDRSWAYVTDDGKMPDQFLDAYDRPVAKVPKRFIEEFNR